MQNPAFLLPPDSCWLHLHKNCRFCSGAPRFQAGEKLGPYHWTTRLKPACLGTGLVAAASPPPFCALPSLISRVGQCGSQFYTAIWPMESWITALSIIYGMISATQPCTQPAPCTPAPNTQRNNLLLCSELPLFPSTPPLHLAPLIRERVFTPPFLILNESFV